MQCRDARHWRVFGTLPKAGGMDDQPQERLTQMQFAEKVWRLFEKMGTSKDWAEDMTPEDQRLLAVLYADEIDD